MVKKSMVAFQPSLNIVAKLYTIITAGNRHKQNSWFCKEIREDNFHGSLKGMPISVTKQDAWANQSSKVDKFRQISMANTFAMLISQTIYRN
jgi:hypothetical protein